MKERTIDILHRLIGVTATSELIRVYGGRSLYVPTQAHIKATPGHPLVELIGMAGAMPLAEYAQGQKMDIPLGADARDERNRRIVEDRLQGVSEAVVAQRYAVSQRLVRMVFRRVRKNFRIHEPATQS